ncbi:unnamed protein product [Paramecium sonneborni]|uniref:Uncharacterized protein n=1 Tax=Paramecium sonneborni TaxID=65129 RepID=A0A8S1RBA9_9CILI|nr:unnamed protein product [Paramecium sonneborni]
MKGKLVQSLINLIPNQHQETLIKCVFIIGFDKLIKKGFLINGKPKIQEIIDYSNKIQATGRLGFSQIPCDVRQELDHLKDEINKLTQQIQYNNSIIQKQTQRSHDRLQIQSVSPQYDDRKRSASVGYKQQQLLIQKKTKEITPKITETIPQTINQINITISKHHLDDTEIKSIMRDNLIKEKPPKPQKMNQDQLFKKNNQIEYQHIDTDEHNTYEDSENALLKEHHIPQVLQYSNLQNSQLSQYQQQLQQQQQNTFQQQTFYQQQPIQIQQLQQSQVSQQSNTRQSDHQSHNTNQTFAQPQSSQKYLIQPQKSPNNKSRSPNKSSPKFKYQQKQNYKKNLETVQEESFTLVKHQSSHSASSKGRGSFRQQKTQQNNNQAVSKIKALLDQDKKIYKQNQIDVTSERRSFINSSNKMKNISDDYQEENSQVKNQELNDSINKRTFQNNSFYKQQQNNQISPLQDSEQKSQSLNPLNQFQGSVSMTNSNGVSNFIVSPQIQDNRLIYSKYKQQMVNQYSPKLKYQLRPQSMGKQQESDFKRSNDFNRSSVSSTFSMFNPNEELKTFFQNDFLERKRYIPQGYNDMTKQSSLNSSQDHQSKYISASQIEEQQNQSKNIYSPQQYQNIDKSNVFNNNRLSVTRILNNSQI